MVATVFYHFTLVYLPRSPPEARTRYKKNPGFRGREYRRTIVSLRMVDVGDTRRTREVNLFFLFLFDDKQRAAASCVHTYTYAVSRICCEI